MTYNIVIPCADYEGAYKTMQILEKAYVDQTGFYLHSVRIEQA